MFKIISGDFGINGHHPPLPHILLLDLSFHSPTFHAMQEQQLLHHKVQAAFQGRDRARKPRRTPPPQTPTEPPKQWRKVACTTLQELFESHGLCHIDLFSLDVEGAELEVLRTVDLNKVSVSVWLIELDGTNTTKDAAVRAHLSEHGYVEQRKVDEDNNAWFLHREFTPFATQGCSNAETQTNQIR